MKTVKKLLAIVLCLAALAGICVMMTGCDQSDTGNEDVTLKWVIPQDEQRDAKLVEAEVNKLLAQLMPNTKVEFVWDANLPSKISMWMAGKEEYDIIWAGYSYDMMAEYQTGAYTELNELIEEYAPNIKAEWQAFASNYATGEIDGTLYAIPNIQPIVHESSYLIIPNEYLSYFPMDEFLTEAHSHSKTTAKMYDLYEGYLESLVAAGLIERGNCSIDVMNFFLPLATRGYDWVGSVKSGAWLCYDALDPNAKIQSYYETDSFQLHCQYMARWYDLGFISKDYLSTGALNGANIGAGNVSENWFGLDDERGIRNIYNADGEQTGVQILLDSEENMFNGTTVFGSENTYNFIPYTCKNPERAIQFLDLLKSEEGIELMNLIVYGFEKNSEYAKTHGVWHYEAEASEADGDIIVHGDGWREQPSASNNYGIPHWLVCNVFDVYRTPNILDGQKEWARQYYANKNEKFAKTAYCGFRPDTGDIDYKIAQVSTVIGEFQKVLISGAKTTGYTDTYNEFVQKLRNAGLQDILAEVQAQADAYNASR